MRRHGCIRAVSGGLGVLVLVCVTPAPAAVAARRHPVPVVDWVHRVCSTASDTGVALRKAVAKFEKRAGRAADSTELREAISDVFGESAGIWDHFIAQYDKIGVPEGTAPAHVATELRDVFDRTRDVLRRFEFQIFTDVGAVSSSIGDFDAPGLAEINARQLQRAAHKYATPELSAAFTAEPTCSEAPFLDVFAGPPPVKV